MNVFMPCKSIEESVRALDDKRLIKQILECMQIIEANTRVLDGEQNVGYANHPVVSHYRYQFYGELFIGQYANACCFEYLYRFNKEHIYWDFFIPYGNIGAEVDFIYAEGSKNSPDCIRETDNEKVHELFKQKLIKKWNSDKYPPKWTNRESPSWYK